MQELVISSIGSNNGIQTSESGWYVLDDSPVPKNFSRLNVKAYDCSLKGMVAEPVSDMDAHLMALTEEVAARILLYTKMLNSRRIDFNADQNYIIGVSMERLLGDIIKNVTNKLSWLEQVVDLPQVPITLFGRNRVTNTHSEGVMATVKQLVADDLVIQVDDRLVFAPSKKLIDGLAAA